jgi:hypothetical protein
MQLRHTLSLCLLLLHSYIPLIGNFSYNITRYLYLYISMNDCVRMQVAEAFQSLLCVATDYGLLEGAELLQ